MKMKLLFVTLLSFAATASYNPQQLKTLISKSYSNSDLKSNLKRMTSDGHYRNSYRTAREYLFGELHLKRDGGHGQYIRDVYCDEVYTNSTPNIGTIGRNRIPNHQVVNCEHTWPQSKFGGADQRYQVSDLHHLFPTQSRANSIRGNYNFGEVDSKNARLDDCQVSKFDNHTFEPPEFHKGNVARAMFYFSVRYGRNLNSHQERLFRLWHKQDPVDADERERNEKIERIQGNRNPFIDAPELVSEIQDF
ncbi:nuclease, EndA/NucM family [Halobacteriovorax sp. BALOs_7]|uniref:endonuclease I family protein n=1 Tax=Halobacteriovorax sp. BALOs_7 TaxID=2109558 RepID=UPI000EA1C73E|nr:endonuclease [Halobacteriovorax sp. BALOs_7]AYF44137.1 nuclease, EndA/NucM family [Halobacteriovorax sp. BALOs_7]